MTEAKTVAISVPATAGDEITVAHDGHEGTTYKVGADGTVRVPKENAYRFLNGVVGAQLVSEVDPTSLPGAEPVAGSTGAAPTGG